VFVFRFTNKRYPAGSRTVAPDGKLSVDLPGCGPGIRELAYSSEPDYGRKHSVILDYFYTWPNALHRWSGRSRLRKHPQENIERLGIRL